MIDALLAHWLWVWLALGLVAAVVTTEGHGPLHGWTAGRMTRGERALRRASWLCGIALFITGGPVTTIWFIIDAVHSRHF